MYREEEKDVCDRVVISPSKKVSEMVEGWIPLAKSPWTAPRKAPAKTVTVVVPSPASTS